MANLQLYNKQYKIPEPIINKVKAKLMTNPTGNGIKRAKYIINNGMCTYQNLKRLKNFFDYFNPKTSNFNEFELAGGQDMRNWIEQTLNNERKAVETSKDAKRDASNNTMIDTYPQSFRPNLTEWFDDSSIDGGVEPDENALAIIFNVDKKILLLRRTLDKPIWGAGRWGFVGGHVEEGETPEEAIKREVFEETGIKIDTFLQTFTLQRKNDHIEHCFITKFDGDITGIVLNDENIQYGWFTPEEMKYIDTVPNLMDYIDISVTKY